MSEMPPPSGSYTPPPPPPPPTGGGYQTPATGGDRTLMVVLSYLWILALIPLLAKKEDREVQWHAKNGLVLLGAEIAIWILFTILGFVMPEGLGLGCGIATVQCAIWIAFLVVRVIAIVKGVGGQHFRLPVVSDMADKF
jgi:uncharacterized membrane protein